MQNPSRRWVSAVEFEKHTSGLPRKHLCRLLRRCDRTIRDWQTGRRPIPSWTIDTLRLREFEALRIHQEMFGSILARRSAIVTPPRNEKKPKCAPSS